MSDGGVLVRLRLEPLTRGEIDDFHGTTLSLLGRPGIRVAEPEAVTILEAFGAERGPEVGTVRIPESVVREALKAAPRTFRVHGRVPGHALCFGDGKTQFAPMGTAVRIAESDGTVRPSTRADVERFYRLEDALPAFDHASWVAWPSDVPDAAGHAYELYLGWKNTVKPIDGYPWGAQPSLDTVEMGAIVAGGMENLAREPRLLGFVNPTSPLTLSAEAAQGLIVYVKHGQPCIVASACLAGGTAPVTLAGVLAQQNAEVLAGIVLAQAIRPGAPVVYGSASTVLDMRTGAAAYGAPELGLLMAATAQLARFYGIPSRGTGGATDASLADYQAGAESATTLALAALGGFDLVYHAAGALDGLLTASYEKFVLDAELVEETRQIIDGLEVSRATLAAEAIARVGFSGNFLRDPHTLAHFRRELFHPTLFARVPPAVKDVSRRDVREEARQRWQAILKDHVVDPPLDPETDRELRNLLVRIERRDGPGSG